MAMNVVTDLTANNFIFGTQLTQKVYLFLRYQDVKMFDNNFMHITARCCLDIVEQKTNSKMST